MKQESSKKGTLFKLLKLLHSQQRSLIPLTTIGSILEAVEPFILMIGGAMILDSLLISMWNLAIQQTVIMLVTLLIIGILIECLKAKCETSGTSIHRLCNNEVCLKAISLDYQTFADKKNLEEFDAADYNVARNGGFGILLLEYKRLIKGIAGFTISSVFLVELCLAHVVSNHTFAFLVTPTSSFILLGVVVIILGFLYIKLSNYVNTHQLKLYYENVELNQRLTYISYHLNSDITFAKEIRMYHMKDLLFKEWKDMSSVRYDFIKKKWDFETFSLIISTLLNDIILLIAYAFVVLKVVVGSLTIGSFTRYVGAIQQMNLSLMTIIEASNKLKLLQSYLGFYTSFLEKENKLDTGSLPVEKRNDNAYELEFKNVSFAYPGSCEYSLKNVSIKLDLKKRFAVVGRNGAGKTTFIKLLSRLYDVSEGCITLNGVDIRKYDYQEYMGLFAAVFQDFSLFSFSIKDNIACGMELDEEKMWDYSRKSGIDQLIQKSPSKMDTLLYQNMGDGIDLSGGEAQKLAITRALYKDAPFVILDEPTAALDPISEFEIYSHFDEMVKDKTSIYISHRMSSCRFCDTILVFDEGTLKQIGTHDELMQESNQVYAKLWDAQAKYYADSPII